MRKFALFALTVVLFGGVQASWYWPFDADEVDEKPKRVSELVESASLLIEEASDLAADGKTNESIEKYREALAELNTVEATVANTDKKRAKSAEFATLRNKRAYVNAAIDSLLLEQVRANAKVVAVSDTTELEQRLDRERWGKRVDKASEAFDRHESDKAFDALEEARAGTTNIVLLAVTDIVTAGVHCQDGKFESACQSLNQARRKLEQTGVQANRNVLTMEERTLVSDILQTVRSRVVIGYRDTFVFGCQICEDNAQLRTLKTPEELTSTNAIALASNVVVRLTGIRDRAGMFVFPEATDVSRVASRLAGASVDCYTLMVSVAKRLDNGWPLNVAESNLTWNVGTSQLRAALTAYGRISPKIDKVDVGLTKISKLFEKKDRPAEKEMPEKESQKASDKKKVLTNLPQTSRAEQTAQRSKTRSRRDKALVAIEAGDWTTARRLIDEMLVEKPNGVVALNLKAAMEAKQGKLKEAEDTLDQAIHSNPQNYFTYYNLAKLMLQRKPDDTFAAQKMYETGRTLGGPVDAQLEEAFK